MLMASDLRVMCGKMRHSLNVKTVSSTQETTLGSWNQSTLAATTRWCSVEPIGGRERLRAGQLVPEATHIIRTRYNTEIVPSCIMVWGSRTFEILSVVNVEERNMVLEMLCKELI